MELTAEQKATIAGWVEAGAELGEIQSQLKEHFDFNLTYLDTRFLLGDLGLELVSDREEEEDEPEEPISEDTPPETETPEAAAEDSPPEPADEEPAPGGKVSVTVDSIAQSHAIISGRVTFSDGESAAWYLDEMGRLGLDPSNPDHQPSEADIASFQVELQGVLRQQGY